MSEQSNLKLGDAVVLNWKKRDDSVYGGTEGVILGYVGDENSGKNLVIDKSTYENSFKAALFSLNILDLKVIPENEIEIIEKTNVRKRPPGVSEKFSMIMEANYTSNIDFDETILELEKRSDCKPRRIGNSKAEFYQIGIKEIVGQERTSVLIFPSGIVQIFCKHDCLDLCINWLQVAVVLLPEHKRLVLIPTKIKYKIDVTYKEPVRSTDELIEQIALEKGGQPVVFPLGWYQQFFSELDENPLAGLVPKGVSLYDYVTKNEKKRKNVVSPCKYSAEDKSKDFVNLDFPTSRVSVNKYLGDGAPIIRIEGAIMSPKDEQGLMNLFFADRSAPWQWFESDRYSGKVVIRDLTINKKKGVYTVELRKYSSNDF